jgi:hypothetical protein
MGVIQYSLDKSFFEQLPYEIVCHIFLFIEKDYDEKLKELNHSIFMIIINEDKYINKQRYYKFTEELEIILLKYNFSRIMSGMGSLAYSS